MARRYEVTDEQWEVLQTYFGNSPKQTGRPQSDNRKQEDPPQSMQ